MYFPLEVQQMDVKSPLALTDMAGRVDVFVNVNGSGKLSQSGAVLLGLARALKEYRPDLEPALRDSGFLTRDARMVERKKFGHKKGPQELPVLEALTRRNRDCTRPLREGRRGQVGQFHARHVRPGLVDVEVLAELLEVEPLAHQDDAVAGREDLVAGRRKLEPAVAALDGDHDHARAPLDVGVAQAPARQGARRRDQAARPSRSRRSTDWSPARQTRPRPDW